MAARRLIPSECRHRRPGDQIYIHAFQPSPENQGRPGAGGHSAIPAERGQIRAYLYPRSQGGWEGAFPDWFEQAGVVAQNRVPNEPEPPADAPRPLRYPQRRPRLGHRRRPGRSCNGWGSGRSRSRSAVGWF